MYISGEVGQKGGSKWFAVRPVTAKEKEYKILP